MAKHLDPIHSLNTQEGKYLRGTIAKEMKHNLDTS